MGAINTWKDLLNGNLKLGRVKPELMAGLPFSPINSRILREGETVSCPMHLKVKLPDADIKFVPFLTAGEAATPDKVKWLADMGIETLYVQTQDLLRALDYLNMRLLSISGDAPEKSRERITILAEHLNLSLRLAFAGARLDPSLVEQALPRVDGLAEEFLREGRPLKLIWEILYRDYDLYKHSVNVCLLGVAMMVFLEKGEEDIRAMGYAGLLHDLGMTRIAEEITYKVGALSATERAQVQEHPRLAFDLLRDQPWMSQDSLRIILEHHENADGSGYPQGLTLDRQHPWTRIMRVIDAYDAITSYRPYRTAQKPFTALRIMYDEEGLEGQVFDRRTLEDFVRFQGFTIDSQA